LHLLRETLPSVLNAVGEYRKHCDAPVEILVVDDGSRDETARVLPREFPEIQLIRRDRNRGFAIACNLGFLHARHRLVALLNNDVRIEPDYLIHQADHFASDEVFAVTAKVYDWDKTHFTTGGRVGRFRRGFWSVYFNYDLEAEILNDGSGRNLLSVYAIGGFATYERAKLKELGGFNELLSPFHWEDVDLSYRAWKRGWKVLYEPRSRACHRVSATIHAHYEKRCVEETSLRNRLLFHWINLHSPGFLARHLFMLAGMCLINGIILNRSFFRALLSALRFLPEARQLRSREKSKAVISDRELAARFDRFIRTAPIRVYTSLREIEEEHWETR